jgi:hypothetical protein
LKNRSFQIITVATLAIADLSFTLYRQQSDEDGLQVSFSAHASGALSGFLIGIAILKPEQSHTWTKAIRILATICAIVLFTLAFIISLSDDLVDDFHIQRVNLI